MKYSIISHITTSCNYNCSYCDVIKDGKKISIENRDLLLRFIENNIEYIEDFKFFGGEPLLAFEDIKYVVDNFSGFNKNNIFEIVTNTSLIKDSHLDYLSSNFKVIYLSVDNENIFRTDLFNNIISNYSNLESKIYINLVIDPDKIDESRAIFDKLYDLGFKGYNLLPVYFTKPWTKIQLYSLVDFIKYILDLFLKDNTLRMYGFMKDENSSSKLAYNSLFVDIDSKVYFSDLVSTYSGSKFKDELFIGDLSNFILSDLKYENIETKVNILNDIEKDLSNLNLGQSQLHKIMDYFSKYLIKNNGKQRKPII